MPEAAEAVTRSTGWPGLGAFLRCDRAATSIEYALLAFFLAASIAAIYFAISDEIERLYMFILDESRMT